MTFCLSVGGETPGGIRCFKKAKERTDVQDIQGCNSFMLDTGTVWPVNRLQFCLCKAASMSGHQRRILSKMVLKKKKNTFANCVPGTL